MQSPELFPGTAATALAAWLLTYAVHSTLLIGAVWLLTSRRLIQSLTLHDFLWKTALVGGLITATVQTALRFEPAGGLVPLARVATPVFEVGTPVTDRAAASVPGTSHDAASTGAAFAPPAAPQTAEAAGLVPPSALSEAGGNSESAATTPARAIDHTLLLLVLWSAGAVLLLVHLGVAHARLGRRLGRREPVDDSPMGNLLHALRATAGIRRPVTLTCAPGLTSPVAIGRSEICVPRAALRELSPAQQKGILAHELAHLERGDPLWLAFAVVLERVLFFQPLNRLARRRLQAAAEYLCDDWAARRTGSGLIVAKCLVKVAEWMQPLPSPLPLSGMAENRSQLMSRVQRLVENQGLAPEPHRRWMVPAGVLLLAVTVAAAPGITTPRTDLRPGSLAGAERQDTQTDATPPVNDPAAPTVLDDQLEAPYSRLKPKLADVRKLSEAVTLTVAPKLALALGSDKQDPRDTAKTSRAVAALIEALRDTDAGVRQSAARALGEREDPRAVPGLITALRDESPAVRAAAANALGQIEDGRAAAALAATLKDPVPDVRRQAANALSQLDDPRAVEPLIAALADADPQVRQMAAHSLGNIADRRAVQPLAALVGDPNAGVRQAVVHALGELGDAGATDALTRALKDANPDVRQMAVWGLGEIGDARTAPALTEALKDQDAEVRRHAAHALGELELARAPEGLLGALKDSDAEVRRNAAWAVAELRDAHAVPALSALLGDTDAEVRRNAVHALGEIRDSTAMQALIDAMKSTDPTVRKYAANALGQR